MTTDLVDHERLYSDVLTIQDLVQQSDTPFEQLQHHIFTTLGPCRLGDELIILAAGPHTQQAKDFIDDVCRVIDQQGYYGWISRMLATVSSPFQRSYRQQGPAAAETNSLRIDIDDICRMGAYVLLTYGRKTEVNKEIIKQFLQTDHVHLMTVSLPKICDDLGLPTFTRREVPLALPDLEQPEPVQISFDSNTLASTEHASSAESAPSSQEQDPLPSVETPDVPWNGAAQQILFELEMLRATTVESAQPTAWQEQSPWNDAEFRFTRLQRIVGPRLLGPALAYALTARDDLPRALELLSTIGGLVTAGGPLVLARGLTEEAFEELTALRVDTDGQITETLREWVRQACADAAFVVLSWGSDLHQSWSLARHLLTGDLTSYNAVVELLFHAATTSS